MKMLPTPVSSMMGSWRHSQQAETNWETCHTDDSQLNQRLFN
ncbi:hypothetical protein LINPERPRIM_LOCUS3170 [Linum perenne]